MDNDQRIERREKRLLRWENYLRRTRHVALGCAMLLIIAPIAFGLIDPELGDKDQPYTFFAGVAFLAWAGLAHFRIRHIETIKRHQNAT